MKYSYLIFCVITPLIDKIVFTANSNQFQGDLFILTYRAIELSTEKSTWIIFYQKP